MTGKQPGSLEAPEIRTSAVIYAKDADRVAAFYARTLELAVSEREAGFVVLAARGIELSVVQIPAAVAAGVEIAAPPRRREETPIKCSYLVDDLTRVRTQAEACGGGTRPPETAWRWRDHLHLDGYDPEGNVVQFRQRIG